MAENNGKRFEKNIQDSCKKQGILFERFLDNGKFGFGGESVTRFSSENPCDGFIYYKGHLIYLELKTTKTGSMSFNQPPLIQEKGKTKPSIKPNQIKALMERKEFKGVHGGLLIDFADRQTRTQIIKGGTYFIDIDVWHDWAVGSGKKSMNLDDAKSIGLEVKSEKLKTNYRYDMINLLERIIDGKE